MPVSYRGRRAHVLAGDVPSLRAAAPPPGVRLLPPYDPMLNTADRDTVVPERSLQRELWRALSNSGAVLVDGAIVAAWRGQRSGRRLRVVVTPGERWRQEQHLRRVDAEAQALAALRRCASASLEVA